MLKFTYNDVTDCLMLKNNEGKLIDYKFYNHYSISSLSITEFMEMIKKDIEEIGNKLSLENYIINLLD